MRKFAAVLLVIGGILAGCVAYDPGPSEATMEIAN